MNLSSGARLDAYQATIRFIEGEPMPRQVRASKSTGKSTRPAEPVESRNVLADLTPEMRKTALRMAGNDARRVVVTGKNRFHVIDPERTD